MSKVVKGIKKGIKKIGKVVKKAAPYILMAAAVYFTAGVALSYFPATSAFSAAMPGFGTAGMFTKAATAIGLSGPASAAAAAGAGSAAATGAMAGLGPLSNAAYAGATAGTSSSLATLGGSAATGYSAAIGGGGAAAGAAGGGSAIAQGAGKGMLKQTVHEGVKQGTKEVAKKGFFGNMSVGEKLLLAKTVTDTASGLFAKEPRDPNKYFWGYSRKGEGMDMLGDGPQREPARGYQSPEDYYNRGTPEFMPVQPPQGMNVANTTPADRQMEEYQTRERDTRDREDDEDFI